MVTVGHDDELGGLVRGELVGEVGVFCAHPAHLIALLDDAHLDSGSGACYTSCVCAYTPRPFLGNIIHLTLTTLE